MTWRKYRVKDDCSMSDMSRGYQCSGTTGRAAERPPGPSQNSPSREQCTRVAYCQRGCDRPWRSARPARILGPRRKYRTRRNDAREAGICPQWGRSAIATTTPSPSASAPPARWDCSIDGPGPRAQRRNWRSSRSSKCGTTGGDGTPRSASAARSNTRRCIAKQLPPDGDLSVEPDQVQRSTAPSPPCAGWRATPSAWG